MLTAAMFLALAALVQADVIPDPVGNLLGYSSGVLAVLALGAVKKYTTLADTAIGKAIKPVQPWIATAGALLIPLVAGRLGVAVDPQEFVAAPVGTLAAIGAAELLARLRLRAQTELFPRQR